MNDLFGLPVSIDDELGDTAEIEWSDGETRVVGDLPVFFTQRVELMGVTAEYTLPVPVRLWISTALSNELRERYAR